MALPSNKGEFLLLFIGIIATLFVLANAPSLLTGSLVYVGIGAILLVVFFNAPKLLGVIPSTNILFQVIIGLIFGAAWIIASTSGGIFQLGVPSVQADIGASGAFIIIVIVAPIFEEALFRGFIRSTLQSQFGQSKIVSNVIQAGLFSLFHVNAFGSFFSQSGNFIGAFLFGIVAGFITEFTAPKIVNLLPSTIAHSMFNAYVIKGTYAIIG